MYMQATIHSPLKETDRILTLCSEKRGRTKSDADRNVLRLNVCPIRNPLICSHMHYRLTKSKRQITSYTYRRPRDWLALKVKSSAWIPKVLLLTLFNKESIFFSHLLFMQILLSNRVTDTHASMHLCILCTLQNAGVVRPSLSKMTMSKISQ